MRPSFANHDDAKKDLLPVIKEGSGAPKGACHPCPRLRRQVCANSRHLSAPRLRTHNPFLPRLRGRVREGARPPFGAHACGTRHRLSPRWLSPRTGFPEDGLRECFARLALLPSVKHAPCRPVFLPVDRGPRAARYQAKVSSFKRYVRFFNISLNYLEMSFWNGNTIGSRASGFDQNQLGVLGGINLIRLLIGWSLVRIRPGSQIYQ